MVEQSNSRTVSIPGAKKFSPLQGAGNIPSPFHPFAFSSHLGVTLRITLRSLRLITFFATLLALSSYWQYQT
jgi:hypothetical protein